MIELFSVIIVDNSTREDLDRTIESIRAQHRHDVECIVVDAGRETVGGDEKPPVDGLAHVSAPASSLAARIERAVEQASGALLAIVEAGTVFTDRALEAVANVHRSDAADFYVGETVFRHLDGRLEPHPRGTPDLGALISDCPIAWEGVFTTAPLRRLFRFVDRDFGESAVIEKTWCDRLVLGGYRGVTLAEVLVTTPAKGPVGKHRPAFSPQIGAAIAANFPDLRLKDRDRRLLYEAGVEQPNVEALREIIERERSARLCAAVARALQARGVDDADIRGLFHGVDWTRPATVGGEPNRREIPPLFTIVIATFNAAADLPATLRSIADQDRRDVECIVVDGGSKDDTLAVVKSFHPAVVTRYVSQKDDGLYDALNKGLLLARGDLIGIVGAGDCYLPGALDAVAAAHYRDRSDVYGGQTIERFPDGTVRKRKDEPWGLNAFVSGGPVGHNAMFATRGAIDTPSVGYFGREYPMAEDTRWMHRAIHARKSFTYIPSPVVLFPLTGMSNNNPELVWTEAANLIKQNFPEIDLGRQEALDLLFAARGWGPPDLVKPVVERHRSVALDISVACALKAEHVPLEKMLEIFGDVKWDEVEELYFGRPEGWTPDDTTDEPFCSFIVPCYNVAPFVAKTLTTILAQNYTDIEVVAIDDGAKDHTLAVLRAFEAIDPRVRVVTQHNQGLGQSRNNALPHCRGRYVWCIDSDDHLQDNILRRIFKTIRELAVDAYIVNYANIDMNGTKDYVSAVNQNCVGVVFQPKGDPERFASVGGWGFRAWRYIVRRSLIENAGIRFPSGLLYEDHTFTFDVACAAETIYVDPSVAYFYLQRPGSIVTIQDRRVFDFLEIRRRCLAKLKAEGLFDRFEQYSLTYVVPADFLQAHVLAEHTDEFMRRVIEDMDERDVALLQRAGGWREFAFVRGASKAHGTVLPGADERFTALADTSVRCFHESVGYRPTHHVLSRSVWSHQVVGLHAPESAPSPTSLPNVFAWSRGKDVFVRHAAPVTAESKLVLRYRNHLDGQVLIVETEGFVHAFPSQSTDLSVTQTLSVPLSAGAKDGVVHIMATRSSHGDTREIGFLVESIEIVAGEEVTFLPPVSVPSPIPELVAGRGSRVSSAHVDVRVRHEDRPYVVVGEECDIGGTFVFERGRGQVRIGDRTSIGGGCLLICAGTGGITIGRDVMLSWNVTVADNDSHSTDPAMRRNDALDWLIGSSTARTGGFKDWSDVADAPVRIEDGCWIGFGSTILKGVTIGEGSVVASNSVVTKSVPPYSIVGGNPARVLSSVRRD